MVPDSSCPPCHRISHPYFLHVTSQDLPQKKADYISPLVDAKFIHVSCFGSWNVLEDMMQVEALLVFVELAWPLVLLPSAIMGLSMV